MGIRRLRPVLVFLVISLVAGFAYDASAAPSASWRGVTFEGVALEVPASWPVFNLTTHPAICPSLSRHAVYLGMPGPDPACPAEVLAGKTESVQLMPINRASPDLRAATRRTAIGSTAILTNPDDAISHTIIDMVPAAGVEVSLSYGQDLPLIRAVEASLRLTGRPGTPADSPDARDLTPPAIPAAKLQGLYQGAGFDSCAAPSAATMKHWLASPYRAIGVYIGGINRGCAQASLTAGWINTIQREGWHYFAFYAGLQASCVDAVGDTPIVASSAAAEGRSAAADAVQQARNLGIPAPTPLIYDMEYYIGCGSEVTTFLSAWDAGVHAAGYQAGVYESFGNISDLIKARGKIVEPDVIHYADWDGDATTSSSYMPASMWVNHQRLHQYTGGHDETWGGATLNIDNDELNVNLGAKPGSAPTPTPTPTPSPPPYQPPFPPFPFEFRIAVGINSSGSAEWFATTATGTMRHSYQPAAGSAGWSTARTVGRAPANLVSNPAVASDQDGRLTVFAVARTGAIVHAWQQPGSPGGWAWGGGAGGGSPGKVTGDPAAALEPDGSVGVFITGQNGAVQTTAQQAPDENSAWTAWTSIGGSCAGTPVPYSASGALEIFCVTTGGALAEAADGPGGWQPWQLIAGLTGLTGVPAVAPDGPGQTAVLAGSGAGVIGEAWQSRPGGSWMAVQGPRGVVSGQVSPAVSAWPGGGIAVFSELPDGQLGYSAQPVAGPVPWSPWTALGSTVVGVPAVWLNASGAPAAAALNSGLRLVTTTYAGSGWARWLRAAGRF
jgi:hypothetical protein